MVLVKRWCRSFPSSFECHCFKWHHDYCLQWWKRQKQLQECTTVVAWTYFHNLCLTWPWSIIFLSEDFTDLLVVLTVYLEVNVTLAKWNTTRLLNTYLAFMSASCSAGVCLCSLTILVMNTLLECICLSAFFVSFFVVNM